MTMSRGPDHPGPNPPEIAGADPRTGDDVSDRRRRLLRAAVGLGAVSALAGCEVILSAGAFNSPQLLMLSGIGPKAVLDRAGIPVRVDLAGVGRNLQDRYEEPHARDRARARFPRRQLPVHRRARAGDAALDQRLQPARHQ